ncbi:helix-turn-helix transcriptional regulator [Streptomyces fimicarius]|uniref:helix-turn-helix transcriptional regulator n=1 Tax=Streptomyces griseus TaxID=1911 RepID=UPI0035D56E90
MGVEVSNGSDPDSWPPPTPLPEGVPWHTLQGNRVLRSGNLGVILRYYRTFHKLSQERLSELIGMDRTAISRLETQARRVESIRDRARIADLLGVPHAALGIGLAGRSDHADMITFGESVVRLSRTAREQGRAPDALRELDRLVRALEGRAQSGKATRADMVLLGTARTEVGVALGDLLPEAHLGASVQWTGSGAGVISSLEGEPRLSAHSLGMYGNELRKAGCLDRAVATLQTSLQVSVDLNGRATASLLLARAASEIGDSALFDQCVEKCRRALEEDASISNFFVNPFSLREVELRGFLITDRRNAAERIGSRSVDIGQPSHTWRVIERVTMGQLYVAIGERKEAAAELQAAIVEAHALRLPHQLERAVRVARSANLEDLVQFGNDYLRGFSGSLEERMN